MCALLFIPQTILSQLNFINQCQTPLNIQKHLVKCSNTQSANMYVFSYCVSLNVEIL